ncbi:MAG: bifunctional 5,10-methylenetetrahydrofolate dehydrogenase/5,10-methenyltetrahydrofolate cyclohydrolase, partial [Fusobacterium sp.]|nr:bifunctional 5,10-methylenetetrahydrofolate dehydrogenase/5,10-methenyltetrahydrofolate cyclohydrolase [Fusobacterium sp.]
MILDGKTTASQIKEEIKQELIEIKNRIGKAPGLAIVLVGENPASKIYVNSKIKGCAELGFESFAHYLPENVTEEELLKVIESLNDDERVDGILVQLPLPKHIDERKVIETISFSKDVDGFKPENMGLLFLGDKNSLKPCTPSGIVELFKRYNLEVEGKDVVIIGRSNIVGKPMAGFFINEGATVTICNSK